MMRSRLTLRLMGATTAACALLCLATPGEAQEPSATRDADARRLFDAAQVMFEDGRFEEAGRMFERAYELSGRSEMLYNAYVAYRDGQAPDAAIRVLRLYLAQPDAQFRTRLEQRLAALEAARSGDAPATPTPPDTGAQPVTAAPEPEPEPEPENDAPHLDLDPVAVAADADADERTSRAAGRPQRLAPHPVGPALVALGTLSLVAGGIVGGVAVRDARRLESRCPGGACAESEAPLLQRAERRADVSTALLSSGGVLAVAGGLLWRVLRRDVENTSPPPLAVAFGRDGASIMAHGVLR